jgi:hypothetical protein
MWLLGKLLIEYLHRRKRHGYAITSRARVPLQKFVRPFRASIVAAAAAAELQPSKHRHSDVAFQRFQAAEADIKRAARMKPASLADLKLEAMYELAAPSTSPEVRDEARRSWLPPCHAIVAPVGPYESFYRRSYCGVRPASRALPAEVTR